MDWLSQLDTALFRFINQSLSNPFFDWLMPILSGNVYFFPAVILVGVGLIWKNRVRGGLCVLMLLLILWPGDTFICNKLKHAIGRPRPYLSIPETRIRVGRGGRVSMPSSHAANWGAATMILFIYYRRSLWIMIPLAGAVCFSRVYNGVHYPSDVLVGAILGAGYAAAGVWVLNTAWQRAGPRCCSKLHSKLPSLLVLETTSRT